ATLEFGQRSLGPDGRGGKNGRGQRRRVAEDGQDVVVGRQKVAGLQGAPVALQADEGLAAGKRAAAGVRLHLRFELEYGDLSGAEVLVAANPEARRVAADANDGRIVAVGLFAADEFEVEVEIAV